MQARFRQKAVIVTGSTRGIGRAMAERFAREGAGVVISGRKAEEVMQTAQELQDQGLDVLGVVAHVGREEDRVRLVEEALGRWGRVDVLVNNAATNPVMAGMEAVEAPLFQKMVEVNQYAPLRMAQLVFPSMQKQGGGVILNISSVYGLKPAPGLGLYSMTKAALIMLTQVLAREWGDYHIRVNAICPGIIRTKFSAALWQDPAFKRRIEEELPLHRVGMPEEVAAMAAFLASDEAAYCTGGVYLVDGGEMLL